MVLCRVVRLGFRVGERDGLRHPCGLLRGGAVIARRVLRSTGHNQPAAVR